METPTESEHNGNNLISIDEDIGGEAPTTTIKIGENTYIPFVDHHKVFFFKVYDKNDVYIRSTISGDEFNKALVLYKKYKKKPIKEEDSTLANFVTNNDISKWQWID